MNMESETQTAQLTEDRTVCPREYKLPGGLARCTGWRSTGRAGTESLKLHARFRETGARSRCTGALQGLCADGATKPQPLDAETAGVRTGAVTEAPGVPERDWPGSALELPGEGAQVGFGVSPESGHPSTPRQG